jgi:hypothetical protein
VDDRIPDGLATILGQWSIVDLFEAHAVLDALDEAAAAQQDRRDLARGLA